MDRCCEILRGPLSEQVLEDVVYCVNPAFLLYAEADSNVADTEVAEGRQQFNVGVLTPDVGSRPRLTFAIDRRYVRETSELVA